MLKSAIQSLVVSLRSTKTTAIGLVFGGALLLIAAWKPLHEGVPMTETQQMFAIVGLALLTGGIAQRDGDKSSRSLGIGEKDDK